MFHVELRLFPANFARFNLTETQLQSMILERWTRDEWVELGERKWNPQEAKLTVLEGPEIALDQLTMGRGWRNAQRHGRDVTEEILVRARERQIAKPAALTPDMKLQSDSLVREVLSALTDGPIPLPRTWELAEQRIASAAPSRSLALAEDAVRSLLDSGLIVLSTGPEEAKADPVDESVVDMILGRLQSWNFRSDQTVWISKS